MNAVLITKGSYVHPQLMLHSEACVGVEGLVSIGDSGLGYNRVVGLLGYEV